MLLIDHLDFDAAVQAKNMLVHTLAKASEPTGAEGQLYTDITSHVLMFHNGTIWQTVLMSGSEHAAVTLATDLSTNLLGLSTQQLTLNTQANNLVFAGPTTGGPLAPTFRSLVAGDIPDLSATYATLPIALTDIASWADGSIIIGGAADWEALAAGTPSYVLTMGASRPEWSSPGAPSAHALLGTAHSDTTSATVSRGSLIYGNATPAWDELVVGTNQILHADGTDTAWVTNATMATGGGLRTTTTAAHTLVFQGYDIDGVTYVDMITIAAHATQPTMVLRTGSILANDGTAAITIANSTGLVTISDDLTVTGDLIVQGDTVTVNVATMLVEDPLIKLGNNNDADVVDLGIYWEYSTTPDLYGGIFRDATDGVIKFFETNQAEPTTTVDTGGTGYALADVAFGAVTAGSWTATVIADEYGGTGQSTYAQGDMLYASAADVLSKLTLVANAVMVSNGTIPTWQAMTTNGQLLIGGVSGPVIATLAEGTGVTITNGDGTITIGVSTAVTRKVSANLGDGDGVYTWNHALGLSVDTDIIVQCWGVTVNTDKQVYPTVTVIDGNNIQFDFGFNVTAGDYKAVLIY